VAAWRQTQFMFEGLCPACSGPVDGWLECCSDHDPDGICARCGTKFAALARFRCRTCKNHNVSSPKALALLHPAVMAFYESHGLSTRIRADDPESVRRVFGLMDDQTVRIAAEDPPRVTVTGSIDGDDIRLTFDEHATVVRLRR
jgi:hypothetical protein